MFAHFQVVEVTTTYAGAYAGRQLAESGLPILRIELSADQPLQALPPMGPKGFSVPYLSANCKKESIRINGSSPQGQELLQQLIAHSHVFLTDRLELFDARSAGVNCHIHAEPFAGRCELPTSDVIVQALSGGLRMTGRAEGPPTHIAFPVGDVIPGLFAAIGVLRGLLEGCPQTFSVHSLDATVSWLSYVGCSFAVTRIERGFVGSGHPSVVPYGAFRATDGYVIVAAFTQAFWRKLCHMLGRADLIENHRFRNFINRRENRVELEQLLADLFAQHSVAEWERRLDEADVPNAPIYSMRQALDHPLTAARGMITEVGGVPTFSTPIIRTSPQGGGDRPPGSRPWQQALQHLGLAPAMIAELVSQGQINPVYTPFS